MHTASTLLLRRCIICIVWKCGRFLPRDTLKQGFVAGGLSWIAFTEVYCIAVNGTDTATGRHLPYGITQRYLPSDTSDHTPAGSGTRFTYPGGMEGWVDLGDLLHIEMVYPPADGHQPKYWPGPVWLTTLMEANALTTTLRRHPYMNSCSGGGGWTKD